MCVSKAMELQQILRRKLYSVETGKQSPRDKKLEMELAEYILHIITSYNES